jgi:hypothetical protein
MTSLYNVSLNSSFTYFLENLFNEDMINFKKNYSIENIDMYYFEDEKDVNFKINLKKAFLDFYNFLRLDVDSIFFENSSFKITKYALDQIEENKKIELK